MTGALVADEQGVEFLESDDVVTCALGDYWIRADLSELVLKKCEDGSETVMDTSSSTNAFSTIGSAVADVAADTLTVTDSATIDFTTTNDPEDLTAAFLPAGIGTVTWLDNADRTWTFDIAAAGVNPTIAFAASSVELDAHVTVDNQQELRLKEGDAGGENYVSFAAPATLAANRSCILEDDANPIPDSCVGDGVDSGGGEWTDTGTVLHPTELGDDVSLGSATLINASKLSIDGDADQVQFSIQADATQTDSIVIVEDSAGTVELLNIDEVSTEGDLKVHSIQDIVGPGAAWSISTAGAMAVDSITDSGGADFLIDTLGASRFTSTRIQATSSPPLNFDDTGDTGLTDGSIIVNCPTLDDCDMDFSVDSGSDTERTMLRIDTETGGASVVTIGDGAVGATPTNRIEISEGGVLTGEGTASIEADALAGTVPVATVGADHIDAVSEIAAGIKRGPDATDTHLLTTDVAAPGSLTCLNMDTDGSIVLAAGACAAAGAGDIDDVGPGCASGACWTDGLVSVGTVMWNWEGTVANLDDFFFTVPADPDFDVEWVLTQPTAARVQTFPDAGGEFSLLGQTIDAGELATSIDLPETNAWSIPDGAAPTVDAAGEIAWDTTAMPTTDGEGQLVVHDGATGALTIPAVDFRCVTIEGLRTSDDDLPIFTAPYAVTVRAASCWCVSGVCGTEGDVTINRQAGGTKTAMTGDVQCEDMAGGETLTDLTGAAVSVGALDVVTFDTQNTPTPSNGGNYNICVTYTVDRA
ncbi:MAG: hypothetical protein ACE5KS_02965 [Woeseiaceae bacterium]